MGKKAINVPTGSSSPNPAPKIYKATFGTGGDVIRGQLITEAEAVLERQALRDVVVCGDNMIDNRNLARKIEVAAHGACTPCPPHVFMGPGALHHFHPDPHMLDDGHCFYETKQRKSVKPNPPKKGTP